MAELPSGRSAVVVCYSEHPNEFFCQLVSRTEDLDSLMNELAEVADSLPPVGQVARGTICCGQFTEDDGWYRAKVLDIDGPKVTVQYIDYGNSEQLPSGRLRTLTENLVRPPGHALACTLSGIEPSSSDGHWNANAVERFRALTPMEVEFTAEVLSNAGSGSAAGIKLFAGDGAVADQLVQERLARKVDVTAAPALSSEKLSVCITFASSPSEFWYQSGDMSRLNELLDYLTSTYSSGGVTKLASPRVGDWCCVYRPDDDLWYRAVVTNLSPLSVRLLDYGNLEHPESVMELTAEAVGLAPQAVQGCLFGVRTSASPAWSVAACQEFSQLCNFGEEVFAAVRRGELYLELTTSAGQSVADRFVQQGHAAAERAVMGMPCLSPQLSPTVPYIDLALGSEWHDVMVSHSDSPSRFFVQLCKNHQVLKDLTRNLAAAAAAGTLANGGKLSVGDLCVAHFDQEYYRGEVVAVEDARRQVFFVDFGNTEWIPHSALHSIQQWACVVPRQTLCCTLLGATASGPAANTVLQSFISQKTVLVAQTSSRGQRGLYQVKLVDTVSQPGKDVVVVDVVNASASTSQASSSGSATARPATARPATAQASTQQFRYPECRAGQTLSGTVVHCVSPAEVYVALDSMQEALDAVMAGLEECGSSLQPLANCARGTPCCAVFSEDEAFYRARVASASSGGVVDVQYVDFGNSEKRSTNLILALPASMLNTPVCAVCCSLANIQQADHWPEPTCSELSSMLLNSPVSMSVVGGQFSASSRLSVRLSVDNVDVGETLCKKALASSSSAQPKVRSTPAADPVGAPAVRQPTATAPAASTARAAAATPVPARTSPIPQLPPIDVRAGSSCKGFVVHADSPGSFYIQLDEHQSQLDNVSKALAGIRKVPSARDWQVGDLCVAVFSDDGGLYRACISAIQGNKASVTFIDYGNSTVCGIFDLMPLPSALCRVPALAIQCCLHELAPASGTQWQGQVCKTMQGIAAAGDQMMMKFYQCTDHLWSVKVFDVKNRDLADYLLAQKLVQRVTAVASPARASTPTQNSAASVPQLRPITLEPGFRGTVTVPHLVNPSEFCCLLKGHEQDLAAVMDDLAALYKSAAAPAVLRNAEVGMACAAQFTEDGEWYRAVIKSAAPEKYEVVYADYGNSEEISRDCVRALAPALTRLPTQALHCALHEAVPTQANGWDKAISDKFAEILMEAEFTMEVVSLESDVLSVRMFNARGASLSEAFARTAVRSAVNAPTPAVQPALSPLPSPSASGSNTALYQPGFMDNATLSYFVSPQCFFVQMSNLAQDLDTIMNTLAESDTDCLQAAEPGLWCAGCASDGSWYRAQISAASGTTATVEFIDYGFTEDVEVGNLSELPAGLCKDREALATCCRLTGVGDNEELSDAAYAAAEALCQQQIQLKVQSTQADGTLLVEVLVNGRHMRDVIGLSADTGTVSLRPGQLTAQANQVRINHCQSPVDFYCQRCDSASVSALSNLQTSLATHCASASPLTGAIVGTPCAAVWSQDNAWYRGVVRAEIDASTVSLCLVDVGVFVNVNKSMLRPLNAQFCQQACLALRCVLSGYESCVAVQFDAQVREALVSMITGKQLLTANVQGSCQLEGSDVPVVQLLDVNGVIIADSLKASTKPILPTDVPLVPAAVLPQVGAEASMIVSYVQSSSSFWCQPLGTCDDLCDLQDQLATAYGGSSAVSHPDTLSPDVCVAALYEGDGGFYRGEVCRVTPRTADVFFLDYGDMKTVKKADIFTLLPQFNVLPRQAVLCRLCTSASIAENAKSSLEELLNEKEVVVSVVSVDKDGSVCGNVMLDGQNVLDFLRSQGAVQEATVSVATTTTTTATTTTSNVDANADVTLIEYGTLLKAGDKHYVRCVALSSPEEIYVQLASYDEALANLLEDMNTFYGQQGQPAASGSVVVGAFFAGPFSGDNGWYRASVLEVSGQDVHVSLVDYGNREWCKISELRTLDVKFTALPQASFCVALPVECSSEEWSEEATAAITKEDVETLLATIVSSEDGYIIAELVNSELHVDLTDSLISAGFAVRLTSDDAATPTAVGVATELTATVTQVDGSCVSTAAAQDQAAPAPVTSRPQPIVHEDDQLHGLPVVVSSVVSPFEFWCQPLSPLDTLTAQQIAINEYIGTVATSGMQPSLGDYCLAMFDADESWYRARVEQVQDDGCARLLFVDYGNQITTAVSGLLPLPAQFSSLPWFAMKCSLYSVEPQGKGEEWSESAVSVCQQRIQDQELVLNLNGQYDSTHSAPVTYLVDALQLDGAMVSEQLISAGVATCTASDPDKVSARVCLAPCKPAMGTAIQVLVCTVLSPFDICCQLHVESDDLDTLSQDLANCYAVEDCKVAALPADQLAAGCVCVAQFSEDGCWYRARILSVDGSRSQVDVRFVDFGNTDTVPPQCVKRLTAAFAVLPEQAFCMSLQGIRPVDGEVWSQPVLDHLTSLNGEVCDVILAAVEPTRTACSSPFFGQMRDSNGEDVATDLCDSGLAERIRPADVPVTTSTSNTSSTSDLLHNAPPSPSISPGGVLTPTAGTSERQSPVSPLSRSASAHSASSQLVQAPTSPRQSLSTQSTASDTVLSSPSPRSLSPSSSHAFNPADVIKSGSSSNASTAAEGTATANGHLTPVPSSADSAQPPLPITISAVKAREHDARSQSAWSVAATTASEHACAFAGDLIAVGQTVAVEITHFESPANFWCQVTSNADSLGKLMDVLNAHEPQPLDAVTVGASCCARYTDDEQLYRGIVESESGSMVFVRFSDYGNAQNCACTDVFALPQSCQSLPLQAIYCELAYATAVDGDWSEEAMQCFQELTEAGADATLVYGGVSQLSVDLQANGCNVLEALIARSLAARTSPTPDARDLVSSESVDLPDSTPVPLVEEPEEASRLLADSEPFTPTGRLPSGGRLLQPIVTEGAEEEVTTPRNAQPSADSFAAAANLSLPPSPAPSPVPGQDSAGSGDDSALTTHGSVDTQTATAADRPTLPDLPTGLNQEALQLTSGLEVEVAVALVSAPSRVWCQAVSDSAALEELSEQLAQLCQSALAVSESHTVGCVYAAFYEKYDTWYRAQTISVGDGSCQMFFIDYGNVDMIGFDSIASLPDDVGMATLRPQALHCQLNGFADRSLSVAESDELTQELMNFGTLTLTVVEGQEDGRPASVTLHLDGQDVVGDYFSRQQG